MILQWQTKFDAKRETFFMIGLKITSPGGVIYSKDGKKLVLTFIVK